MGKSHYIIPIFVPHEGCPHNCVFCNQNSITGMDSSVTAEHVDSIVKEYLSTIVRDNSTVEVSFFGGTFTAINYKKQEELLAVAYQYKKLGFVDYIRLSTRPDCIDEATLDRLKKYSVDIIELGVQSMDDEVLKLSGRGHVKEDTIKASRLIKEYGFTLGHQLMIGLPGDNHTKDIKSALECIELQPDMFRIYPALVLKDTPMERMYEQGIYKPYSLKQAVEISKDVYSLLIFNNIKILRVGLQATENIAEGRDIVTGPYHPAFRELVEGTIYSETIKEELDNISSEVKVLINWKDISKLYTNKKEIFNDMKKQLTTQKLTIEAAHETMQGSLVFHTNDRCWNVSIEEHIARKVKEGIIPNL